MPESSMHATFLFVLRLTHVNTRSTVLSSSFGLRFTTTAHHKVTETASLSLGKKVKNKLQE